MIQGNGNNSSNQSEPEDGNSSEQKLRRSIRQIRYGRDRSCKKKIKEMTLEEKIGQMVIVGFDGYTIDDSVRAMIQDYHVSGFILYGRNVESSSQLLELINSLKRKMPKTISSLSLYLLMKKGKNKQNAGRV